MTSSKKAYSQVPHRRHLAHESFQGFSSSIVQEDGNDHVDDSETVHDREMCTKEEHTEDSRHDDRNCRRNTNDDDDDDNNA